MVRSVFGKFLAYCFLVNALCISNDAFSAPELNLDQILRRIHNGERGSDLAREAAFEVQERLQPMHYAHSRGFTNESDMPKLLELVGFAAREDVGPVQKFVRDNLTRYAYGRGLPAMMHSILTNNELPRKYRVELISTYVANLSVREVIENYDIHFEALNEFTGFYSRERGQPLIDSAMEHLREAIANNEFHPPNGYGKDFQEFRNQPALTNSCSLFGWARLSRVFNR